MKLSIGFEDHQCCQRLACQHSARLGRDQEEDEQQLLYGGHPVLQWHTACSVHDIAVGVNELFNFTLIIYDVLGSAA